MDFTNFSIMEDIRHNYLMALTAVIFIITNLFLFFLKTKVSNLLSWIWKKFNGNETIPEEDFHNDIVEIKAATEQIIKDWMWMRKSMAQIKNDQTNLACQLQTMYEAKCQELEQDIIAALGKIAEKNDQKFQEMKQSNEKLEQDINFIKAFLDTLAQQSSSQIKEKADDDGESKSGKRSEIACVTKVENRLNEMSCHMKKNEEDVECDTSKLITILKQCLTDLFKEVKLHLSVEREEGDRELEIILTKLAEDREDVKRTILQAFAIAAEQAQTNYKQFGQIGEDSLKYIAVLNDNTNKLFQSKLNETGDVLKSTLNAVSRQTHDFDAIRKSVENMDEQFDKLFEKLAQIYQVNMEHSEIIALSLEKTSDSWQQNISKIERMAKQLCEDTKFVQQAFQEIKNVSFIPQQSDADKRKGKSELMQNNAVDSTMIQDKKIASQKAENMILVYSCWERMRNISCNVEDGCHSICQLIDGLEQKLRSLNESTEKLDDFIRELNLDILAERATSMEYGDDAATIVDDIMKTSQGDAGDASSQVITSRLRSKSLTHKMQIDNAIKFTEILLRQVCEKDNYQANENLTQPQPNTPSILTDKEQKHQDSVKVHKESKKINQNKGQ